MSKKGLFLIGAVVVVAVAFLLFLQSSKPTPKEVQDSIENSPLVKVEENAEKAKEEAKNLLVEREGVNNELPTLNFVTKFYGHNRGDMSYNERFGMDYTDGTTWSIYSTKDMKVKQLVFMEDYDSKKAKDEYTLRLKDVLDSLTFLNVKEKETLFKKMSTSEDFKGTYYGVEFTATNDTESVFYDISWNK